MRKLRDHPPSSSIAMLATVAVEVSAHDLANGGFVGAPLSGIFFAQKIARVVHAGGAVDHAGAEPTYNVTGQVFFASAPTCTGVFDFKEVVECVQIDVSRVHLWDSTAVGALDELVLKFRRGCAAVEVIGLDQVGATLVDRSALHDKPGAVERLMHRTP